MSKNEELIDALRSKSGPLPWGPDLFTCAADALEAQDARTESLEAEVADLKKWWGRSVRATEKREQERDFAREQEAGLRDYIGNLEREREEADNTWRMMLESTERAWRKAEQERDAAREAQDFWRQRAAELEAIIDNGDPAYTTRIREEAVAGEWEYAKGFDGWGDPEFVDGDDADYWQSRGYEVVRRRKAGPWEPVPGGDSNAQ